MHSYTFILICGIVYIRGTHNNTGLSISESFTHYGVIRTHCVWSCDVNRDHSIFLLRCGEVWFLSLKFTLQVPCTKKSIIYNFGPEEGRSDISAQKLITVNGMFSMLKWWKVTIHLKILF